MGDDSAASLMSHADALSRLAELTAEVNQLRALRDDAEVIRDVHAVLTDQSTFAKALDRIMRRIMAAMGAVYAQVWERHTNSPIAHLLAFSVRDPADEAAFAPLYSAASIPLNELVIAHLFDDPVGAQAGVFTEAQCQLPRVQAARGLGVCSYLTLALRVRGRRFALFLALRHSLPDASTELARLDQLARAVRPILARKLDEEKLVLLGSALSATQDGIMLYRSTAVPGQHLVHLTNEAFNRKTGYPGSELAGQSPWQIISPLADRNILPDLREKVAQESQARAELPMRRRDGSTFWGELTLVKLPPVGDREEHFLAVLRDVTQRRADAEAQRYRERELQIAARSLSKRSEQLAHTQRIARLGAWRWQRHRDVLDVSDSIYDLAGQAPGQFLPTVRNTLALLPQADRRLLAKTFMGCQRGGVAGRIHHFEFRLRRPDGKTRHVWTECSFETDQHGRLVAVNGIAQDITERKEAQEMLLHSEKLRSLGQLTGGIAHDFNNLLTVISLNLDIIGSMLGAQHPAEELRAMAAKAAQSGAELTSNLLAFARRQPLAPIPLDIARLLGELRSLTAPSMGKLHQLNVITMPDLPRCLVDRAGLESALLNLLVNARDAMPAGGQIEMVAAVHNIGPGNIPPRLTLAPGRYISVSVVDSGTGIALNLQDRVFEPFFTTKPPGKGTGLGLSSAIGFARQSGGDLEMQSAPGLGTVMRIYVPAMAG